ncbi:sensor histidine kinase [Oceanospirillum sediminis]|uniref:sensor histidine kinase n=1 Tax=Oceanospirillum sediminis TaxID=2760088 RepID=UPI001C71B00B|nr:ATP-binding protein [Oceanospirillum sediminis]
MRYLRLTLLAGITGLIILLSIIFYLITGAQHIQQQKLADYHADKLSQYINNELNRFQAIPELLASNYMIIKSLSDNRVNPDLNHLLLEIAHSSGSDHAIYLMDISGTVIASSNYMTGQSFIGSNFSFRPYFRKAASGQSASYYALGLKSGERGVFFSAPIYLNQKVAGVVTFKMEINRFEQNSGLLADIHDNPIRFIAWGEDQVVFISNFIPWQLKQIQESGQHSWTEIDQSRRYPDLNQQILPGLKKESVIHNTPLWQLSDNLSPSHSRRYIYSESELPLLRMKLAVLIAEDSADDSLYTWLILGTAGYLLLFLAGNYLWRRLAGYRQLLFTRASLEQEVSARTAELEATRDALVQTARLATVGQLSASINHEINQPLSAISTYLMTSRRMLDKGMPDKARDNLDIIESLLRRVHSIVAQLKQFSRQDEARLGRVSVITSLKHALTIIGPQLKQHDICLQQSAGDYQVQADSIRLEQVLVNLLSNACDAMSQIPENHDRILDIRIYPETDQHSQDNHEKWVIIKITDTGPGLNKELRDAIFEPFFTTKSEKGLGLGLSISRNIIRSFDGELGAEASEQGASFTIRLKQEPFHG